MFATNPTTLTIGVILAVLLIAVGCWYAILKTRGIGWEATMRFMYVFLTTLFSLTWVVDKVIATKTHLLSENESEKLFIVIISLISTAAANRNKNEDKEGK